MKAKSNILIILFILFYFLSCKKDDKISDISPLVDTVVVTNITNEGAEFNCSLLTDPADIIDHGFVFGTSENPIISNSESISLGKPSEISFSAKADYTMIFDKIYYVSSYAKTREFTYYSEAVSFKSLGSLAPEIISVTPVSGISGDTLTIYGKNFSDLKSIVLFNDQKAKIIASSKTLIKVLVPSSKGNESATIFVNANEQKISYNDFKYKRPEILDFYPTSGTFLDTVYLKEKNYSSPALKPTIFFNQEEAKILSLKDSVYAVLVPSSKGIKSAIIRYVYDHFTTDSDQHFSYNLPFIREISPQKGINGDLIKIRGTNFGHSSLNSNITVKFDRKKAFVVQLSDSLITVFAPVAETGIENATISVETDFMNINAPYMFIYQKPIVSSLSRQSACGGDTITIEGKYMLSTNTLSVMFGSYKVEKYHFISDTLLKVIVPFSTGIDKVDILVQNNGLIGKSNNQFKYQTPVISTFSPKEGLRDDEIIIEGSGFGHVPENISIYIDQTKVTISEFSPTRIKAIIPKFNQNKLADVKIKRDGLTIIASEKFRYIAPKIDGIYPTSGKAGDIITITGNYFSSTANKLKVTCSNYNLNIISCSINEIKVTIPNTIPRIDAPILVSVDGNGSYSDSNFKLITPWARKAGLPVSSCSFQASYSIDNQGYIRTNNSLLKYNPQYNSWSEAEKYNYVNRSQPTFFQIADKLYYGGGGNFTDFHRSTGTPVNWLKINDLPDIHSSGTFTFVIDNKAYNCGGNVDRSYTNTVRMYDPHTDQWIRKTGFPFHARSNAIAFSHNGKGYVGCGSFGLDRFNDFYEYDPVSDNWTEKRQYPGDPTRGAISFVINGRIFAGLGLSAANSGTLPVRDIWEYHPESDTWTHFTKIPNSGGEGFFVFVINNKAYIGGVYYSTAYKELYEFDPSI
jgi:hypothetical protein